MRGQLNSGLLFPTIPPKLAMSLFEVVFVPQVKSGEIEVLSSHGQRYPHEDGVRTQYFPGSLNDVNGLGRVLLLL